MNLDTKNVMRVSFNEMLRMLEPMALEPIPSGKLNDPDMMMKLDELLSTFANNHAYLIYLWAFVSAKTNEYKLVGNTAEHSIATKKKEALYGIASAVKLKWDAVSRKITVRVETNYGEGRDKRKYDKPEDWRLMSFGAKKDEPKHEHTNRGSDIAEECDICDVDEDDLPPFHVGHVSPHAPVVEPKKPSGWDNVQ